MLGLGYGGQRSRLFGGTVSKAKVPDLCDLLMNECTRGQRQVPSWTPVEWAAELGIHPVASNC